MQKNNLHQQLTKILNDVFKFQQFRQGQLDALTKLIQDGRLLCIQPTGYGKSLLYQLPAVLLNGLTLVISPLLALMRDQTTQLTTRFGISAASINTDQTDEENETAKNAAISGTIKLLFIAPEQLDHIDRFNFLLDLPVKLLVVDEAHCISTWGHDFRPSYRQIIKLAHALTQKNPELKLLGLTATANVKTESDIKQQLKVDNKEVFVHRESMDRPNIRLSVIHASGIAMKLATITTLLSQLKGSGLIYCATRENTELVSEYLNGQGIKTAAYHAGIDNQEKRSLQLDFITDQYPIIVATNALGMGIDKPNLRYIIHFDYPGSITAYYQEVGRSGRDGLPAEGILLYDPADSKIQKHFIESAQPTLSDFQTVLQVVADTVSPNLMLLKRLTGMHPTKLTVIVAELVEQDFLIKVSRNRRQSYELTRKSGNPDLTRYHQQFQIRNTELQAMQSYAESQTKCLMLILREALGDLNAKTCGQCSGCVTVPFKSDEEKSQIVAIQSWLSRRTVPISLSKKVNALSGIAVLDGKLRSMAFIQFMRERATSHISQLGISDFLMQLIKDSLQDLAKLHNFGCIIVLPSTTWGARDALANLLGNHLKIPSLLNALFWSEPHVNRQGELLNNDQRQHNVAERLRLNKDTAIPKGAILLLDDYIGSGATLNEATRALREGKMTHDIVPFTIAAIKWRLGKSGMI